MLPSTHELLASRIADLKRLSFDELSSLPPAAQRDGVRCADGTFAECVFIERSPDAEKLSVVVGLWRRRWFGISSQSFEQGFWVTRDQTGGMTNSELHGY